MHIALNKFLKELESLSPGVLNQIENLYPLDFNIEVSSLSKFSSLAISAAKTSRCS